MTGCQSNAKYNLCDYFSFSDASSFAADLVKKMFPALCPSSFVVPLCLFLLFSRCLLALIQSTDRTLLLFRCWCGCTQQHRTLNWTHILQSGRKSAHHTVSFPLFLFHSFIYSPFSSLSFLFFLSLLS